MICTRFVLLKYNLTFLFLYTACEVSDGICSERACCVSDKCHTKGSPTFTFDLTVILVTRSNARPVHSSQFFILTHQNAPAQASLLYRNISPSTLRQESSALPSLCPFFAKLTLWTVLCAIAACHRPPSFLSSLFNIVCHRF